ncbi:MAG TPA: adenylate kinase [Candidatus Ventricola gallistercoris]|nr:adenylate kinase [Candidatus Ventricola gallistercoris]
MQKVLVIGCPGAGKSTFARGLRDATGLPLYYLDMLWHRPDRTTLGREAFDAALLQLVGREKWIIDGNYLRTLGIRLAACDTVFLLDYPVDVCLAGAAERIGKPRQDLPWVELSFDAEFRQWIENFPREQLPQIYHLLAQYRETRKIIIFHSRKEAQRYIQGVQSIFKPSQS